MRKLLLVAAVGVAALGIAATPAAANSAPPGFVYLQTLSSHDHCVRAGRLGQSPPVPDWTTFACVDVDGGSELWVPPSE
ncbi:hypothetical protein Lfu02_56640 [Longispora fulva]|uniref:Secreted protein n=1 Tax=Longispora fulva TaxID=619741 RepID=A0A8J7GRF1_9ACTN|nr:hypothetical protein [Longispora fulva]MBG6137354.1 hypothetical protein [Longispora fulva]GIG61292.1 hypothetical protein Lfu02_56640 [Longispora fulva]